MSDKGLQTTGETRIAQWGQREELREIARRVQLMAPGGQALKENEALALAQGAVAHGLDPFNGEIWFIPGRGLMAGIKGLRKAARSQLKGTFWAEFEQLTDPDLRRSLMIPNGALAFRCIIRDSETIRAYAEMWDQLAQKHVPVDMIPSVIGQRPYVEGVGYLEASEKTKMDPVQCAMKRAEADALKRRFDLPFAVPSESEGEYIDAPFAEVEDSDPAPAPSEIAAEAAANGAALYPPIATLTWSAVFGDADEAWLVEKKIVPAGQDRRHLIRLMDLSPFKPDEPFKNERGLRWFRAWRGHRDAGKEFTAAGVAATADLQDRP